MSRTPLFAAVKKALAITCHDRGIVLPRSSALSRRRLLRLSAAAAGAAALSPVLDWSAFAKDKTPPSIAIVGGGVAGLTAAYRLQAVGVKPVLFEASSRWGGRMLTVYDFYKGMFCELGGQFVDTGHEDLIALAKEFGIEMQTLATEGEGEDLYYFGGAFHTPKDMIDTATKTGAFAPIAEKIAEDAEKLTDKDENWTKFAHKLDRMSLKAYLEQFRGKTENWAIDLLDVAYVGEFGLETEEQSSLNMVDFIATEMDQPFRIFGESDEAFRIKGGSSALIKALTGALENKADMRLGYALTALDRKAGKIVLTFAGPDGEKSESFDATILTLPFTKLRDVKGLNRLKLAPEKLKCIRELGMGTSAKVINGTTSRVWRSCRLWPARAVERRLSTRTLASKTYGRTAARSRAKPASSPTFSEGKRASPRKTTRSRDFAPALPRWRRRWPKASTRRRSRPFSGPAIRSRSAAMPGPSRASTRPCWTWRLNPPSAAGCSSPASIRALTLSAT